MKYNLIREILLCSTITRVAIYRAYVITLYNVKKTKLYIY